MKSLVKLGLIVLLTSFSIGLLTFLLFNYSQAVATYTVNRNIVYINDSNAIIEIYPHTIGSGYVYINLTSKTYTGDIDVVFGFNSENAIPKSLELYSPREVNTTKSWDCNPPRYYNYTTNPKYAWCWLDSNGTTYLQWEHSFEWYDLPTNTIYWNETRTENWKSIANLFDKVIYDYQGYDTWYLAKNVPIIQDNEYHTRFYIQTKINTEGKYWVAFKPSSETLSQAIANGHFYYIDPWWNNTYNYKRPITVNTNPSQQNFTLGINVTYDSDMQTDFRDVVFVNASENQVLGFWLDTKVDSQWAYYYVMGNWSSANGTQAYIYYNLTAGNYTIVRNVEIDPDNIWIDYGQDVIGKVEILEDNDKSLINLKIITFESEELLEAISEPKETDKFSITGLFIEGTDWLIGVVIVIIIVGLILFFNLKKKVRL